MEIGAQRSKGECIRCLVEFATKDVHCEAKIIRSVISKKIMKRN